jgi:hypothetical protein
MSCIKFSESKLVVPLAEFDELFIFKIGVFHSCVASLKYWLTFAFNLLLELLVVGYD